MIPADAGWDVGVVNATGVNVVATGPCLLGGYIIVGAAGAFTMDVYDNASAASGTKVIGAASVAAAVPTAGIFQNGGVRMQNGIVANMSGDPTDGQILVLFRK